MADDLENFKKKLNSILKIDVYCGLILGLIYSIIGIFGLGIEGFIISFIIYSILWILVGIVLSFIFIYMYKNIPGKELRGKMLFLSFILLVLIPIPFALIGNLNFSFGYVVFNGFLAILLLLITSIIFSFLFSYFWRKNK